MNTDFNPPTFDNGSVEFRFHDNEVAIYATADGLRRLASLCMDLADKSLRHRTAHIHLEDLNLLTRDSLHAAIAVLRD